MDEARRQALYARREAILAEAARQDWIKHRAEYVAMVPILKALEDAGDDYDSYGFRELRGALNHWACYPGRYPFQEVSRADLPADSAARDAIILDYLRQRFGEHDRITVVLRREELVLSLRWPVLVRHLDTLFENAKSNWLAFVDPPADWIIATYHVDALEVSHIHTGTLVHRED